MGISPAGTLVEVRDMSYMFYGAVAFDQSIQRWDTSQVLDMSHMFSSDCNAESSFNQPLGDWNTSQVTGMGSMFSLATSFNQPIGDWNTSQVTDMGNMYVLLGVFGLRHLHSINLSVIGTRLG